MLVKYRMCLALCALMYSALSGADEVSDLRDMARLSEDHRELTIDCLIELKTEKASGWKSEECLKFKEFSTNELQVFKSNIKATTSAFKVYSKEFLSFSFFNLKKISYIFLERIGSNI